MKVLHVIPSLAETHGGPTRAAIDMVSGIRSLGVDAELITTNYNGNDTLPLPLMKQVEYSGIPVTFFERFPRFPSALHDYGFSWDLSQWLWHHCQDYDLIHIHALFGFASTIAMTIARAKSIPYVCTPHGLLGEWALRQKSIKKQIYLRLVERSNIEGARALHFTAEMERNESRRLGLKVPDFVCPCVVNLPKPTEDASRLLRNELAVSGDEPIILYLSRIHTKKGLEYLIPALAANNDIPFTFVLAGSGDPAYELKIRHLVDELGIQDRTRFPGFVTGESKNLLLQGADLFVLTSHTESFGIAVLEALGAGTPVLITPGVALSPLVKDKGLGYVPNLDVNAITAALRRFLNERETARLMGQRGREYVHRHYAWSRVASDLIQVYQSVLSQQPLPNFTET